MSPMWAIVEREWCRFRQRPVPIFMALALPLVHLLLLGHVFGGTLKHLRIGFVDLDRGLPALQIREWAGAVAAGTQTYRVIDYADLGQALDDLRNGELNGVLTVPEDFSRRLLTSGQPRLALIQDNTDNVIAASLTASIESTVAAYVQHRSSERAGSEALVDVVEVYPYVTYMQYLLAGVTVMSMFLMAASGGLVFIDDKVRGLHEGYLVTPISNVELIAGFNISGAVKAVLLGLATLTIGALAAGLPSTLEPSRLVALVVVTIFTAFALVSLMFLMVVRVADPTTLRMSFGIINTVLFFASGAVFPREGFPPWLQVITAADPFTYSVHAYKSLLLKGAGFASIAGDLLYLGIFSVVAMTAATLLFKRTL